MNEMLIDTWYKDLNNNRKLDKFRKFFEIKKITNIRLVLYPKPVFLPNWRDFEHIVILSQPLSYDLYENKKRYCKPRMSINVYFDEILKTKELTDYNSWKKIVNYLKKLTSLLPNPVEPPSYFDFFEL